MQLPKAFFILISILIPWHCYGMKVIAIPAMNGYGSSKDYIKRLLSVPKRNIVRTPTPQWFPDFGQQRCMQLLENVLKQEEHEHYLIHATSQGGATALNYAALHDKGKQIKGMILEAPLVNGNSAIHHTMQGPLAEPFPRIGKLPFSYYWLPYATKLFHPFYTPTGTQALTMVKDIPVDMPIIIIHALQDPQISFEDSCALYYALKQTGHKYVYFLKAYNNAHLEIIDSNHRLGGQLRAILAKHGLIDDVKVIDIPAEVQPEYNVHAYKEHYRTLMAKEKNHWLLHRIIMLTGYSGLLAFAVSQIIKEGSALKQGWHHEI